MKTLGTDEVADILKVHANRVLEWVGRKELKGIKLGRAWVFREQDVEEFLNRKFRESDMSAQ